jgi:hypothetical protein
MLTALLRLCKNSCDIFWDIIRSDLWGLYEKGNKTTVGERREGYGADSFPWV